MLDGEHPASRVERNCLAVAQTGGGTFRWREGLVQFVGVIAPDAGTRFQLGARIDAGYAGDAILTLARVGRRSEVDEHIAHTIDRHRVHRMVAGQRQAGDDGVRLAGRSDTVIRQLIAYDLVVRFGIHIAVMHPDPGAAMVSLIGGRAETHDFGRRPVRICGAHRDQEPALGNRVVVVISAAPGIGIDDTVGGHGKMARMSQMVGKDAGVKTGRQYWALAIRRRRLGAGSGRGK